MNEVEKVAWMPIRNPATGAASKTFVLAGKIDGITDHAIIDWKTTSDVLAFVQAKTIGCQGEIYALLANSLGYDVHEIHYRLITTPKIRPSREDDKEARFSGRPYLECYEDRCVAWIRSAQYGVFEHVLHITEARLKHAEQYLWHIAKAILQSRATGAWIPNEHACQTWSRTCEYMPLCMACADNSNYDAVQAELFEAKPPNEELGAACASAMRNGQKILTYSAASTYAMCAAKYYWRHVACLKPKREDADARWVGSAVHAGLEMYSTSLSLDTGLGAVDAWASQNPVLGVEGADKRDVEIRRARAVVRVAAERWPAGAS